MWDLVIPERSFGGFVMARSEVGSAEACLRLLRRLMSGEKLTAKQAADAEGAHQAPAVRRHLELLEEHVPGVRSAPEGRSTAWHYERPLAKEPDIPRGSSWALAATRALVPGLKDSALGLILDELTVEVARHEPDGRRVSEDLARKFYANHRTFKLECLDVLAQSLLDCREITAEYEHFGGHLDGVRLRPLTLIRFNDQVYCYGHVVDSSDETHIDTDRLYNVEGLRNVHRGDLFAYPTAEAYRPDDVFHPSFDGFVPRDDGQDAEDVVLEFAPRWESYLRNHVIHRSQSNFQVQTDEWVRVELRVYVLHDLVRFVRGLGKECRVVAPEGLKDWVQSGEGSNYVRSR